jgi:hypothetical protein
MGDDKEGEEEEGAEAGNREEIGNRHPQVCRAINHKGIPK